jgi:acetate kinase
MTKTKDVKPGSPGILTINGGSSSVKFALFDGDGGLKRRLTGKIERIGAGNATLSFEDERGLMETSAVDCPDHGVAAGLLIDLLGSRAGLDTVGAIGHRVVHGMEHCAPEPVTEALLEELKRIRPFDPQHLPSEIELIEAFRKIRPGLPQVACFDTAFHSSMPRVARIIPIPRGYEEKGLRRYGFHGISYAYLMEELFRLGGMEEAGGRIVLLHLGNGASMAAVHKGRCVDTSMGFTPAAGLPMGTRTGDLDPGVAWYLMSSEKMTPERFNALINRESGLLGISGTSPDMRDLLERLSTDIRAAEAVEFFCYQTRKWLGAFAAALGGLDTLVFSGGIGENASEVRFRVLNHLGFLGVELDQEANASNAPVISTGKSRVKVRVIPTDEELMIARAVRRIFRGPVE